jgi:hypothetical protein
LQGEIEMKRVLATLVMALPFVCSAEDVAINFTAVPIAQFVQSTYKAMLKRDYVIAPELLAMEKPISVSVRSVQSSDLPKLIDRVVIAQGVKVNYVMECIFLVCLVGMAVLGPLALAMRLSFCLVRFRSHLAELTVWILSALLVCPLESLLWDQVEQSMTRMQSAMCTVPAIGKRISWQLC